MNNPDQTGEPELPARGQRENALARVVHEQNTQTTDEPEDVGSDDGPRRSLTRWQVAADGHGDGDEDKACRDTREAAGRQSNDKPAEVRPGRTDFENQRLATFGTLCDLDITHVIRAARARCRATLEIGNDRGILIVLILNVHDGTGGSRCEDMHSTMLTCERFACGSILLREIKHRLKRIRPETWIFDFFQAVY